MRLSLERDASGQRGWSNFLGKLVRVLTRNYNVKLVDKKESSDVHLSVISGHKKGSKNVVRIDGVYYDVNRMARNTSIYNSIKSADGVIFQSEWCRTFATGMLKITPKDSAVVFNGIDQKDMRKVKPREKLEFEQSWMCCAHWRTNKRPEAIAEAFIKARSKINKNVGLYFIGEFKEPKVQIPNPNIRYLNKVEHNDVYAYLKAGNWMCHICHVDSCPNSVVEGLSCGLPVLCNNIGGTPEITGKDGIILPLDKPFSFEVLKNWDLTGSKYINTDLLADGMVQMMSRQWNVSRPDLDISVAAKKYYDFFVKILGK